MILFTLTMPNINTWNNTWSGVGNIYAKTRPNKLVPNEVVGKSFYYNFGDGWGASIAVEKMSSREAEKFMRKSNGFMGYDWMIDSIISNQEIVANK